MRGIVPVLALIVTLTTGCTQMRYSAAVKAGARAAESGAWEEALARYGQAREIKQTEDVEGRMAEVRAKAIEEALAEARSALDDGEFEEVMERLAFVQRLDPDQIDVFALQRQVEASLLGRGSRAFKGGYPDTAYVAALRLKKLFPSSEEGKALLTEVRTHYLKAAETHRRARAYDEAMKALQMIRDQEPDQEEVVAPAESELKAAWAEDLVKEARQLERAGRLGPAAMAFARAYAFAGHSTERDDARRLAEKLRLQGAFTVELKVTGLASRGGVYKEALEAVGSSLPELVLSAERPDVKLYLNVPAARCSETSSSERKSVDYVAGTIDVPNEDRKRIEKEIAEANRAHDAADREATALWPRIESAREHVDKLTRELEEAERVRTDAQRKEDVARDQAAAADKVLEEKQAAVRAAQAGGNEQDVKDAKELLDQVARNVEDWKKALTEARTERERADARYDKANKAKQPAEEELERLRERYQQAMNDRDAAAKARTTLTSDLRHAPMTVKQNVDKTLTYDEKHWKRTCTAHTAVAAYPRWTSKLETTRRFAPSKVTEDVSHRGHEQAGLVEDRKAYPETDAELVAAADRESAEEVRKWLVTLAEEHYAQQRALLDEDPVGTEALALYLGAPGRLDDARKDAVRLTARAMGIPDIDAVLTITAR